jgi:hypothetical protein
MARGTCFKSGDKVKIDPKISSNPKALQKLIGRTQCDVTELQTGLLVTNVVDSNIELVHPRKAGTIMVSSRHFVHAQV